MHENHGTGTDGSLIPAIAAEENRLSALLQETRAETERRTREAEQAAELAIRKAEAEISGEIAERKEEAFERAAAEARCAMEEADREAEALRDRARARMGEAVDYVVSLALRGHTETSSHG